MEGLILYNKSKEILNNSSSGGVFYELAKNVIEEKGVVFGAAFDEKGIVVHKVAESLEEINQLCQSKYVESDLRDTLVVLKEYAEKGREILFSGTPCQVAAIRKYMDTNGLEQDRILLVDFVCHGTPEKKFWIDYLSVMKKKYGKISGEINFRDKRRGWRNYGLRIPFEKKDYFKSHYTDEYMYYFLNDYLLKDGCFRCGFRKQNDKASDITLADAWQLPVNQEGTSLIFLNREAGKRSFKEIKDRFHCVKTMDVQETIDISGSLEQKRRFLEDYQKYGFSKQLKKKYMCGKRYYVNVLKSLFSRIKRR